MKLKSRVLVGLCVGATLATCNTGYAGNILYTQPGGDGPVGGGGIGQFSHSNGVGSKNIRVADNFSLSSDSSVTNVSWWGGPFPLGGNLDPFRNVTGFLVEIFNAVGGLPGASAGLYNFSTGQIGTSSATPIAGFNNFRYDVALPTALNLAAGDYIFSVAATLGDPNPTGLSWAWESSFTGPDNGWLRTFSSGGAWTPQNVGLNDGNLAFELVGALVAVPLPAPIFLGAVGIVGVILVRRKLL